MLSFEYDGTKKQKSDGGKSLEKWKEGRSGFKLSKEILATAATRRRFKPERNPDGGRDKGGPYITQSHLSLTLSVRPRC